MTTSFCCRRKELVCLIVFGWHQFRSQPESLNSYFGRSLCAEFFFGVGGSSGKQFSLFWWGMMLGLFVLVLFRGSSQFWASARSFGFSRCAAFLKCWAHIKKSDAISCKLYYQCFKMPLRLFRQGLKIKGVKMLYLEVREQSYSALSKLALLWCYGCFWIHMFGSCLLQEEFEVETETWPPPGRQSIAIMFFPMQRPSGDWCWHWGCIWQPRSAVLSLLIVFPNHSHCLFKKIGNWRS